MGVPQRDGGAWAGADSFTDFCGQTPSSYWQRGAIGEDRRCHRARGCWKIDFPHLRSVGHGPSRMLRGDPAV